MAVGVVRNIIIEATYLYTKHRFRYNKQKEILGIEEGLVGPCMNQASAPSEITHLTPVEKDRLSNDLKVNVYVCMYMVTIITK